MQQDIDDAKNNPYWEEYTTPPEVNENSIISDAESHEGDIAYWTYLFASHPELYNDSVLTMLSRGMNMSAEEARTYKMAAQYLTDDERKLLMFKYNQNRDEARRWVLGLSNDQRMLNLDTKWTNLYTQENAANGPLESAGYFAGARIGTMANQFLFPFQALAKLTGNNGLYHDLTATNRLVNDTAQAQTQAIENAAQGTIFAQSMPGTNQSVASYLYGIGVSIIDSTIAAAEGNFLAGNKVGDVVLKSLDALNNR